MRWFQSWKVRQTPPAVKKKRGVILRPSGLHYDLKEIFTELNLEYFENKLQLPITWYGNPLRQVRRHRTLGSYHFDHQLIRIHRLLDHPHFPHYFISYVVYHEMLHSIFPPKRRKGGGYLVHHFDFKAKEKEFRHFSMAKQWEKHFRKHGLSYGRPQ
jgi:hypothetical protein